MAGEQLPPEAEAAPAPEQGGGDQFGEMVSNLSDGLAIMAQMSAEVDPQSAQAFEQLNQQFQALVDQLAQKMSGGGSEPPGSGMASPEAGGSGAIPVA